ncbi:trehalase-like domain-containing protein [Streptomyces sp. NPDC047046]|uniref:trehalase-like domain-containing protein n=1 Tax=Streptomyces sp. NPDC047046 TaxID=3155378 RepID=UPI0033FE5932
MLTSLPSDRYGLIGTTRTAALVADSGEIAWLCPLDFNSPAVLAALLGGPEHCSWPLAPSSVALTGGAGLGMVQIR